MNNTEIISYIKNNKGAGIAELQKEFGVTYKAAKEVIDELTIKGDLVYSEGVRYSYIDRPKNTVLHGLSEFERLRNESDRMRSGSRCELKEPSKYPSLREFFDARKKAFEENKEDDDDEEDDDDDDDKEESDDDSFEAEIDEDELRYNALQMCISKGSVSISMLQRSFPIGYFRACRLIDWMESSGFISSGARFMTRKVLITQEEFDSRFSHSLEDPFDSDDDDDALSTIDDLVGSMEDDLSREEQKPAVQSLVNVFSKIAENKRMPISADIVPPHNLWPDDAEFSEVVMERMKRLIKSDIKMGQQGAVKKAEACLDAVRDTHDRKMIQVYERLVYEIKNTSNYLYAQLKKQIFED